MTPIQVLGDFKGNQLYAKREDMIPYSFGGNKARKGKIFFDKIDKGGYGCVVTYGGSHSNHCRIIANMAAERKMPCYIISPKEVSEQTYNSRMVKMFGADITSVPTKKVHDTIENKLRRLEEEGKNPYFIPGGGHGNIGTQAYVECYAEICDYENQNNIHFDYIFLASGTGTTQAGLICGQMIQGDERKIVGISVARKKAKGRGVVIESIFDYFQEKGCAVKDELIQEKTIFIDDYVGGGYGEKNMEIKAVIENVIKSYGMPLDSTYTGKAFWGMEQYIRKEVVKGKKILFVHTGGTPLFFDDMESFLGI